nr:unnamed protein product [Digitaria exilis]CAB3500965.1 unnamed protein product [Digitaria exilis]
MDGALLLIAANESCPQPQTSEHLAAVEIMRLQHIIILQKKIDLIQESSAMNQHEAIQKFIQGTIAEGGPVVPISAQLKYNTDGVLRVNQKIEVRPGIVMKDENGNIKCTPIYSRIVSLYAEQNELQFAVPGGLIGVGTTMDPTLTQKAGKVSKLTKGEILMLNIGSMSTGARVLAVKNDLAKLQLTAPVCTSKGEKVALSRHVEKYWRLIGWGQIQAGTTLEVPPCPL